MSEDQPAPAWWRPAIVAGNDLSVGPANPDRPGAHQNRAILASGLRYIFDASRLGSAGFAGECPHPASLSSRIISVSTTRVTQGSLCSPPAARAEERRVGEEGGSHG